MNCLAISSAIFVAYMPSHNLTMSESKDDIGWTYRVIQVDRGPFWPLRWPKKCDFYNFGIVFRSWENKSSIHDGD